MDNSIKKHLQDILTAIEEIDSFFGEEPKLYDDFYSKKKLPTRGSPPNCH